MTKNLFIIGSLLLLLAGPALAGQSADLDWGRVKTLYGSNSNEPILERSSGGGHYGTLTPVEPTLTAPDLAKAAFILDLLKTMQSRRPELELWRDPEIMELLDGGDRGTEWFHKAVNWVAEHISLSTEPSGINVLIRWDGGCIAYWHEWGGSAWSFGGCA